MRESEFSGASLCVVILSALATVSSRFYSPVAATLFPFREWTLVDIRPRLKGEFVFCVCGLLPFGESVSGEFWC